MTCIIAYKNGVDYHMIGDTLISDSNSNIKFYETPKIFKNENTLFGVSGSFPLLTQLTLLFDTNISFYNIHEIIEYITNFMQRINFNCNEYYNEIVICNRHLDKIYVYTTTNEIFSYDKFYVSGNCDTIANGFIGCALNHDLINDKNVKEMLMEAMDIVFKYDMTVNDKYTYKKI